MDEDSTMATNVTIDLSNLFVKLTPVERTEMSLTANSPVSSVHRLQWNISKNKSEAPADNENDSGFPNYKVTLAPMDIKTYLIRFQQL
jgi:hypothetical protein